MTGTKSPAVGAGKRDRAAISALGLGEMRISAPDGVAGRSTLYLDSKRNHGARVQSQLRGGADSAFGGRPKSGLNFSNKPHADSSNRVYSYIEKKELEAHTRPGPSDGGSPANSSDQRAKSPFDVAPGREASLPDSKDQAAGASINDRFNQELLQKSRSMASMPRSRRNFNAEGPLEQRFEVRASD